MTERIHDLILLDSQNRGPELFQRFNVHTEIKLILILNFRTRALNSQPSEVDISLSTLIRRLVLEIELN